jgi:hypothetical protein
VRLFVGARPALDHQEAGQPEQAHARAQEGGQQRQRLASGYDARIRHRGPSSGGLDESIVFRQFPASFRHFSLWGHVIEAQRRA